MHDADHNPEQTKVTESKLAQTTPLDVINFRHQIKYIETIKKSIHDQKKRITLLKFIRLPPH